MRLSFLPSPGGGGSARIARCETGWGDGPSTRAPFEGRDCHPTPPLISFASTLPLQAGLSHVQEHIDEEAVVPGSTFELASQGGLCIGMSASNIEGKSPQNGEVGGSVVFSASGLILVENDVEGPVQDVFDAPMFANDAQQFCGRVTLRQKEVALDGLVG